eukprot:tig00022075_g23615.t1
MAEKKPDAAAVEQLVREVAAASVSGSQPGQPSHKFWSTQPVGVIDKPDESEGEANGPIEPDKNPETEIRADPYPLPEGFEWVDVDIDDETQIGEVYTLLNENYVEDDDAMFRFDYSVPFLRWALKPPGFRRDWHAGVRATSNKKLLAFITAVPAKVRVYNKEVRMVEINFLCVHKKLRSKRLAPVLIREITRRVNRTGVFQAVYTAGVQLPTPVSKCRYWHRSLNPKKLIEVNFSRLAPRMTMARTQKLYALPEAPLIPGIRPMEAKDVKAVHQMLNNHLKASSLAVHWSEEEVAHNFIPRDGIIHCYVVEEAGKVTDMVSFYVLPSTIIGNTKYPTLKAAYSFYNVPGKHTLEELVRDALILAKQNDFDVFNALDIFDNGQIFKNLKFGVGDGNLQYYLFNWQCREIPPEKIGLVLM